MVPTHRPPSAEAGDPLLRGRVQLVRQQKSFPQQEPSMTDDIVSAGYEIHPAGQDSWPGRTASRMCGSLC
jgi:hypothetical protein